MKYILFIFILTIASPHSYSQTKIQPNRIGLKLGHPYIIGLDYEHNFKSTERISIYSDIFYFKYKHYGDFSESGNINLGTKIYLIKKSKGLFTGINLGYLYLVSKSTNVILHDDNFGVQYFKGTSELKNNSIILNPNIGYTFIFGHFAFSPQFGFNLKRLLTYSYKTYAEGFSDFGMDYPDYNNEKNIDDLASKIVYGSLTLYLSIGIAF